MRKYIVRYVQDGDFFFTKEEKEGFIIEADSYTLYENGNFIFTKHGHMVMIGSTRNITVKSIDE